MNTIAYDRCRTAKKLLIFTTILVIISGGYVIFAPVQAPISLKSWRSDIGELAGGILSWLFVIIYGRTLLKLLVKNGSLMERILPDPTLIDSKSLLKKAIYFLNKTHPYIGASAVVMVFLHALLEGLNQANFLMDAIIVLALWQFCFGVFLLSRYQAVFIRKMKRYGYMAHSQLYTGIAIGVFALFGHILVGG